MPSITDPSDAPRVARPAIGWPRWWAGAALLAGLLAFIVWASWYGNVPARTIGIMFIGWLIPFFILLSHLRPRPPN